MLNDTERKVLQILYNRNGHQNTRIMIPELALLAQREVSQIQMALERLQKERLIERSDTLNFIKVVPGAEHQSR